MYVYSYFLLLKHLNKCYSSSSKGLFVLCLFFNKWLFMNNESITFVNLE